MQKRRRPDRTNQVLALLAVLTGILSGAFIYWAITSSGVLA
jgi:hypothetical protein